MPRSLPADILKRASLRGNDYAWPVEDIPLVIEAGRAAGLVNFGGQLQFRTPDGTCECYWVGVSVGFDESLPWQGIVQTSADEALRLYEALKNRYDFLAEGHSTFRSHFDALKSQGRDPADYMCFVWDALNEGEWRALKQRR